MAISRNTTMIPRKQIALLGFIGFLLLANLISEIHYFSNDSDKRSSTFHDALIENGYKQTGANSGAVFIGSPYRSYSGRKVFTNGGSTVQQQRVRRGTLFQKLSGHHDRETTCNKWSVVTTIFDPSDAIVRAAQLGSDWCLVIVGDNKTPTDYMERVQGDFSLKQQNVFFFSVEEQKKWIGLGNQVGKLVSITPENHFGRKNLGFLYATLRGAKFIFDFDDDNFVNKDAEGRLVPLIPNESRVENVTFVSTKKKVFNHHPLMGASIDESWARGLPLGEILDKDNRGQVLSKGNVVDMSNVGVIQFCADENPDIDAIHRFVKPLPMNFAKDRQPVMVPSDAFSPYNAQATVHTAPAFFATLLPVTVKGRVSDIWRSYFGQALFQNLNLRVIFAPPSVTQIRNEHNYYGDMDAERDLYFKGEKLVEFLSGWTNSATSIPERMEQLYIELYERGYIELLDVEMVQFWLGSLVEFGYSFAQPRKELITTKYSFAQPRKEPTTAKPPIPLFSATSVLSDLELARVLDGGVLPIRRFVVKGGRKLSTFYGLDAANCNAKCMDDINCHAWNLMNQSCHLFDENPDDSLDAHQADNNDIRAVVGFMQRNSKVLRPISAATNHTNKSERILYILHFHHDVIPDGFLRLMNEILPSSWLSYMDLVVISPLQVNLNVTYGLADRTALSLRNPFRNAPSEERPDTRRGANGIMSLPIAQAKFPGYAGYALINDDAALRTWDLDRKVWFADRPWGQFQPKPYRNQSYIPRYKLEKGPWGPYPWSWANFDSGSVGGPVPMKTRSNSDAAMDAMNEFCGEPLMTEQMTAKNRAEFCTTNSRLNQILKPYKEGKADALYVPNNDLGKTVIQAITLFGEHDVFMEMSYPMINVLLVPDDQMLEMPYCDGGSRKLDYRPVFNVTMEEGKNLTCPLIHPIKFGVRDCYNYWKEIVETNCTRCQWKHANATFWSILHDDQTAAEDMF
jgi:hypothetical protein